MMKQIRNITGKLLAAGIITAGITTGATAYAASVDTGAAGALADSEYTINEMLEYAIEDEYLAKAEYDAIMKAYGDLRPMTNLAKAEEVHIGLLTPLLEKYGVSIPQQDWESQVTVPESLEAAYSTGIEAEKNNIAMYESFLKEELPEDVKDVFERLMNASNRHLAAFERQADGTACTGLGNQRGNGNGSRGGNRQGQGNRAGMQGSCILQS